MVTLRSIGADAATIQVSTQEFFVPEGFSATRVWSVTPHRSGSFALNITFRGYNASLEGASTAAQELHIKANEPLESHRWRIWGVLLATALLLALAWFLGNRRGKNRPYPHTPDQSSTTGKHTERAA
jgi:hypothetical protein